MSKDKKNKGRSTGWSFRGMCAAAGLYLAGCVTYTAMQADQAGVPPDKNALVSGFSFFLGIFVPLVSVVIGKKLGEAGGTLVASVGEVGYRMVDQISPQENRETKIEKFRETAISIGKGIGIAAVVAAGFIGLHAYVHETIDDAQKSERRPKKPLFGAVDLMYDNKAVEWPKNTYILPGLKPGAA